ncbi:MAG: 50S ribosomal protein L10 [Desulfurococcaceae archaeon TW002]
MKSSTKNKLLKIIEDIQAAKKSYRVATRKSIIEKGAVVNEIKKLLTTYKTLGVVSLEGVSARELAEIKKSLSSYGVVKVLKNTIVTRALRELGLPSLEEFLNYLTGPNLFIFTNLNAFMLANLVDRIVVLRYVKPGEKAPADIYVPEGPTGIPPGPMMSVFGKLKIRTMVREGIIWIAKESKVASAGDVISPELASLLRKLEIKAYPVKLSIKAVLDKGVVIPADKLKLDIESFKKELLAALQTSRILAVETALPLPEVMPEIIIRAYTKAINLACEIAYVTPENTHLILGRAINKAQALAIALMQKHPELNIPVTAQPVTTTQPPQEVKKPTEKEEETEEEKEKEVSEEEIAEGISSLFG